MHPFSRSTIAREVMVPTADLSRRSALRLAAAVPLLTAAPTVTLASTPPSAGTRAPAFFRFALGDAEITLLLDGAMNLPGDRLPMFFEDAAEPDDLAALRQRMFPLPDGGVSMPVGVYLLNTGRNLALIDAGGPGWRPTLGRMPEALAASGYRPEDVDTVLLTHLHPEHALGISGGQESPSIVFPNAEIVVNEIEHAFWLDDANIPRVPQGMPFVEGARAAVAPYTGDRLRRYPGGREIEVIPGVTAVPAYGHTAGHTTYRITSGNAAMHVWGDIVHLAAIQLARPDWRLAIDQDPAMGAQSRRAELERVAGTDTLVGGIHLPWPGVGRIVRDGQGFAFIPLPWQFATP